MRQYQQKKSSSLSLLCVLILAGCQPDVTNEQTVNELPSEPAPRPTITLADPPMDRSALLLAVAKAASASSLGQDDAEWQRELDGRRFEVRIRFGCPTGLRLPTASRPFNLTFNREDRTLRVSVAPDLTLKDPAINALAVPTIEAVEGFWLYRPWLLDAGCPKVPAPKPAPAGGEGEEDDAKAKAAAEAEAESASASEPAPLTQPRPRVGIAQFFSDTDPRTGRRDGRAFETTKVLAEDEQPSTQGYNLVLSGRLRRLPQGGVITCRMADVNEQPRCIVSAQFDRVRIEKPESKEIVAEWTS